MNWRDIKPDDEFLKYLPEIWRKESSLPELLQRSSRMWTPSYESFVKWAASNQAIHGLFDDDRLMACIYIEPQDKPQIIVIHLSIVERLDPAVFVTEMSKLRDHYFHQGVRFIRGWTLRKNFALVKLMRALGFGPSGLRFDQGSYRGRVLRWDLLEAVRG